MSYKLKTLLSRPSDKELLKLWREIALLRAKGKCEYPFCQKTEHLNAHHIYTRSHKSVRYEVDNCLILCAGHHSLNTNSAHKDPDFLNILVATGVRSKKFFEDLRVRAFTPAKLDLNGVKLYLQNELKKYDRG
jgi:hypothetical protein